MSKPITITNTFAAQTGPIPLSQLDTDFTQVVNAINDPATYQNYVVDTGSANTYVVTPNPAWTAYAAGMQIQVLITNTNTGASTLNVSGLGANNILSYSGFSLSAGALPAGSIVSLEVTASSFRMLSDISSLLSTPPWANGLINGGMEIWQDGTAITIPASSAGYGPDQFNLTTLANQSCGMSQQTGLVNGSQWCCRIARQAAQTGIGQLIFEQPFSLEEIKKYLGQKITITYQASTGANWSPTSGTLNISIFCGTGTARIRGNSGYTGEAAPLNTSDNIAAGTPAALYTHTSVSVIPTTTTQMTLAWYWTPVGTAGTNDWFQLDDVMWSVGTAAQPFERIHEQKELSDCMRYYERIQLGATGNVIATGFADTSTAALYSIEYAVPKISAPTITFATAASDYNNRRQGASNIACSVITALTISTQTAVISATVASGLTAGEGLILRAANGNANIQISSRL